MVRSISLNYKHFWIVYHDAPVQTHHSYERCEELLENITRDILPAFTNSPHLTLQQHNRQQSSSNIYPIPSTKCIVALLPDLYYKRHLSLRHHCLVISLSKYFWASKSTVHPNPFYVLFCFGHFKHFPWLMWGLTSCFTRRNMLERWKCFGAVDLSLCPTDTKSDSNLLHCLDRWARWS